MALRFGRGREAVSPRSPGLELRRVRVPTGSPPGKPVVPRRLTRSACKAAADVDADDLVCSAISSLPEECVVEVFRFLELHPLLNAARVCRRWRLIAQDPALWSATRFTTTDGPWLLQQHFAPLSAPRVDHTGSWTRCERVLGRLRLMCRSIALDYVEAGEGVSYRLLRSISCLQQLHHPTIVPLMLVNVDVPRNKLQLFYGDVGVSLEDQLKARVALPMAEARCVLRQVLQALAHCHAQGITHRNIKPKYILLDQAPGGGALPGERWSVRLSDFNSVRWLLGPPSDGDLGTQPLYGAARVLGASSPTVVTLPYRAPEILLGCSHYTTAIDVWACGCVFAEAVSGSMLFMADSDIGQIFRIFALLGTPGAQAHWPAVQTLPHFNEAFPRMRPAEWSSHPQLAVLASHQSACSLLRQMVALDPAVRISAAAALTHPFLRPDDPAASLIATPPRMLRPISPPVSPPPRPLPVSLCSGGLPSGGLFGTPSPVGDSGWVWHAWRRRERAGAVRLTQGTAKWRAGGVPSDAAREAAALWLHGAACQFCRSDRSVHLAVCLLDHLLASAEIPKGEAPLSQRVRMWAAASLLLACKFQEVETHTVDQLASFCKHEHSVAELLEAELRVVIVLKFDLAFPTAVDCLFCVLGRLAWPTHFAVHRGLSKQAAMLAQLLCDLSLLPAPAAALRPSLLASAALCLAVAALRCGRWADGSPGPAADALAYWTPAMALATGYDAPSLRLPLSLLQPQHEAVHRELGSLTPTELLAYAHSDDPAAVLPRWAPFARKFSCRRFLNVLAVPPFQPHTGGALPSSVLVPDDAVDEMHIAATHHAH